MMIIKFVIQNLYQIMRYLIYFLNNIPKKYQNISKLKNIKEEDAIEIFSNIISKRNYERKNKNNIQFIEEMLQNLNIKPTTYTSLYYINLN
jgi:hypothetical protein